MSTKSEPPTFLHAEDIAKRLGVSRFRAFEIMRTMPRLKIQTPQLATARVNARSALQR